MAASVWPTPGKLYLTPTTVTGTTGTLIDGIEERDITLSLEADVRERFNGIGPRMRMGTVRAARLLVPLRKQDTTALKILFSHLTTSGTSMRPTGGTASLDFAILPSFALILRPDLSTEKYVYSPNWSLSRGSIWLVTHNMRIPQLANAVLELVATRPSVSVPPCEWAGSSTIASTFTLTENPS